MCTGVSVFVTEPGRLCLPLRNWRLWVRMTTGMAKPSVCETCRFLSFTLGFSLSSHRSSYMNLRKRIPPRVSSSLSRWVVWDRSGITVEMKSGLTGFLCHDHGCPDPGHSWKSVIGLWLPEVPDRPSWWLPLYLYRSFGFQKGAQLVGWPTQWPLLYNTYSENGTRNQNQGSTLWGCWSDCLPCELCGPGTFGTGSPY